MKLRRHVLISVHVPKTGGRSFQAILEHHYGNALWADHPWEQRLPFIQRGASSWNWTHNWNGLRDIRCIHGHFQYRKYRGLRRTPFVTARYATWLRHPVERVLSAYYYLRRLNTPEAARDAYEQEARTQDPEQWCSKWGAGDAARMLDGARLADFAFVGLTERYDESIDLFYRDIIGRDVDRAPVPHHHRNQHRSGETYDVSQSLRRIIESRNAIDLALYEEARRLMDRRLAAARG